MSLLQVPNFERFEKLQRSINAALESMNITNQRWLKYHQSFICFLPDLPQLTIDIANFAHLGTAVHVYQWDKNGNAQGSFPIDHDGECVVGSSFYHQLSLASEFIGR